MVLEKGAKSVVLASHLGRPDGCVVDKFSGFECGGICVCFWKKSQTTFNAK